MPAHPIDLEYEAHISFFGDAHEGHRGGEPGHHSLRDGSAFVDDQTDGPAALGKAFCNLHRTPVPAQFLVVTQGEVERAPGLEAIGEEHFRRLEDRKETEFIVQAAAAPDEAIGHHRREGRMDPVAFAALIHGHHVLVGEQNRPRQSRIAPGPAKEQAMPRDQFEFQAVVNEGIVLGKVGAKSLEGPFVHALAGLEGDRRNPKPTLEALEHRAGVEFSPRQRVNVELLGLESPCPKTEHQSQGDEGRPNPPKHISFPLDEISRITRIDNEVALYPKP